MKKFIADQIKTVEEAGTTKAIDMNGMPIVVYTIIGAKSGEPKKVPLMKVEENGTYAAVASNAGAEKDPAWIQGVRKDPNISVQDGSETHSGVAREISDDAEYDKWWKLSVAAFPPYADYKKTAGSRVIPIFLLETKK